jgi:hypothetical protein
MATFVSDSFTDTSNQSLGFHTGETGATWTEHTVTFTGDINISDANRARHSTANGDVAMWYASGTPINANYEIAAPLKHIANTSPAFADGVVIRLSTSAVTGYLLRYITDGSFGLGGQWLLGKYVAGTFTSLGSYAEVLTPGDEPVVRLRADGDQISVYVDDVLRIGPITDTAITAAGRAGMWFQGIGSDTNGNHLSSFTATDITGATTVTKTATLAGILQRTGITGTASLTGLLQSMKTAQATMNAVLASITTSTVTTTLGTVLKKQLTSTVSVNALLSGVQTKTVTTDALLMAVKLAQTSLDAILAGGTTLTLTASLNTVLQARQTLQTTLNAVFLRSGLTLTTTLEAILADVETETAVVGAGGHHPGQTKQYPPIRGKLRRILLPDGRIVQPRTIQEQRRIISELISEEIPEAVERIERPAPKPKRQKAKTVTNRPLLEVTYRINPDLEREIAFLSAQSAVLEMTRIMAMARALGLQQAVNDDEEALMAILAVVA